MFYDDLESYSSQESWTSHESFTSNESCASPTSQDFWQTMSTNVYPQCPSPTASDIAPPPFPINSLFDEILLEIFTCYVGQSHMRDAWHTLARVCRRWRSIAFGSPRRLNLRIFCSERVPVRKNLESWPSFPIVLTVDYYRKLGEDNILATLEHHDRICQIAISNITSSLWEKALPLMQEPFPTLTNLNIRYTDDIMASVIPDSFLGGWAPRLKKLHLENISFPGLSNLLLSTTDLVHLNLDEISDSGYIPPDAMIACLSTLTRLESLMICFKSPRLLLERDRRLGRTSSSSSTRTFLPSLTCFKFKGVGEYLEDIVDEIDAPLLDTLKITFFHQPISNTPRLAQFIGRLPKLETCNEASMRLDNWHASVKVVSLSKTTTNAFVLLEARHGQPDFLLSPLVQLCTSCLPQALIPTVGELNITGSDFSMPPGQDGLDDILWREILRPFTGVNDLYLSPKIAPHIALVLEDLVGESLMELLPALQNIFLKELQLPGLVPEGIEHFVTARRIADHPISVSRCETEVLLTW